MRAGAAVVCVPSVPRRRQEAEYGFMHGVQDCRVLLAEVPEKTLETEGEGTGVGAAQGRVRGLGADGE